MAEQVTPAKHAVTNPTLWINLLSLAAAMIAAASGNDWVRQNPQLVVVLMSANFIVTGILQAIRDVNKPPKPPGT